MQQLHVKRKDNSREEREKENSIHVPIVATPPIPKKKWHKPKVLDGSACAANSVETVASGSNLGQSTAAASATLEKFIENYAKKRYGCVACGAAPGTLQSMVSDLGGDSEVGQVHFDSAIKDAQKPLIQEYLEQATGLEFVQVED